jgi:hypothetical protein
MSCQKYHDFAGTSIDRPLSFESFQNDFDFEFGAVRFALLLIHALSFGNQFTP